MRAKLTCFIDFSDTQTLMKVDWRCCCKSVVVAKVQSLASGILKYLPGTKLPSSIEIVPPIHLVVPLVRNSYVGRVLYVRQLVFRRLEFLVLRKQRNYLSGGENMNAPF